MKIILFNVKNHLLDDFQKPPVEYSVQISFFASADRGLVAEMALPHRQCVGLNRFSNDRLFKSKKGRYAWPNSPQKKE